MKRRTFVKNSTLSAFSIAAFGALNWNGKSFEGDNMTTSDIVWDKPFGTFMSKPVGDIKYGLAEFEDAGKQSFLFLIVSPFMRLKSPVENY